MKLKAAAAMLLLLTCAAARAQVKPLEIIDGHLGISFVPTKGAARLGEDEAARLSTAGRYLKAAFRGPGNETLLVLNTLDAAPNGLSEDASVKSREELMKWLESEVTTSFPGAEWMAREVKSIDGPLWIHLRYKAAKAGRDVVSDTYAITWFGRVIVFDYLCPAEVFERQRVAFEKSASSIRLTLFAFGPPPQEVKPRGRKP
jgi:hypothetical protein